MNSIKLKLIHIHTDYKFVSDSSRFEGDYFENTIVVIKSNQLYKGVFQDSIHYFKENDNDFELLIKLCNKYDLVVLYGLDSLNQKIAISLNKQIKIAWRFFGYELYDRIPNYCYSEKTKKILNKNLWSKTISIIKKIMKFDINIKKYIFERNNDFEKIVKRINMFLCVSLEEYDLLTQYFPYLPYFIKISLTLKSNNQKTNQSQKSPLIIIGNNRHAYNNHLDIIELILASQNKHHYEYSLFFSYGQDDKYTSEVLKLADKMPNTKIIKDFLSYQEFDEYYNKVSAFVLNSYREMALGSTLLSLRKGVKVYLNTKNIVYTWLKNEGFIIFTIEDFIYDLENNNLILTDKTAQLNNEKFDNIINKYTINDFQNSIYEYLKNINL